MPTGHELVLQEVVGRVGFLPEGILTEKGTADKGNRGNEQLSREEPVTLRLSLLVTGRLFFMACFGCLFFPMCLGVSVLRSRWGSLLVLTGPYWERPTC